MVDTTFDRNVHGLFMPGDAAAGHAIAARRPVAGTSRDDWLRRDGRDGRREVRRGDAAPLRAPRAASEGAVRRKERPTAKGVVGNTPSTSSGCMWVDERRHRKGATELQSKKSQPSEDIYDQVSSLVEELKSARARALAAGGQLPRAVEAAASALEPLLRLRDVTGAACDLTAMPWLPQLLTVFRNVLRTAVDGVGSSRATGGNAGEDTARMAQAAAAAAAAISALGADPQLSRMECDLLRDQIKKQDSELKIAKQRERELQRQLEQVQQQRDQLLNKESDGGNWFARRVVDLEREQSEWNTEKQSVEVKISELVEIVSAALEDEPLRRARERSNDSRRQSRR